MFLRCSLVVASLLFAGIVSASNGGIDFSLADASGKIHTAQEFQRYKAITLVFVATDCPNANTYAPVLARLYREYSPQGVLFLGVYSDPDDAAAAVRKHDSDYQIPYPGLLDPHQTLARETAARTTPEAVVLSPAGDVLYRGRVDDRFVDFGKTRYRPTREDLRDALDQVLKGQPVKNPATKVLGCAIPGVN